MGERLPADEFASRTDTTPDELERYRSAGLLDLDGDGLFDDIDLMRLSVIHQFSAEGGSLEDLSANVRGPREGNLFPGLFEPAPRVYAVDEAVERSGFSAEQLIALNVALGLPSDGTVNDTDLDMTPRG